MDRFKYAFSFIVWIFIEKGIFKLQLLSLVGGLAAIGTYLSSQQQYTSITNLPAQVW